MKINLSKKNYVISAGADGLGFAIANKIMSKLSTIFLVCNLLLLRVYLVPLA